MNVTRTVFRFWSVAVLVACSAQKPEPAAPESPSTASAESGGDSPAASAAAPAGEASESSAASASTASATPRPTLSPEEVLLQEDAVFLVNLKRSDIGQRTEETCTKQAGDDPARKAKCMSASIGQVQREGMLFEKKDDTIWYVRFGIVNGKQIVRTRVKAEVGKATGSKFTLTTSGTDSVPKELEFEMPDQYTLIYAHPKHGKQVFELRFDLIGEK